MQISYAIEIYSDGKINKAEYIRLIQELEAEFKTINLTEDKDIAIIFTQLLNKEI